MQVSEATGARLRWLDFDVEDCTLRQDMYEEFLSERTKLVALGYASNAVGTVNPIKRMIAQAQEVGALTFIDAVQYAPHGPIDVQDLGCDFLAVSAYKFFGPHIGVLYGQYELLQNLVAYKVRPAPDAPPGKFETGTQNHEGIAGALGAVKYLASIGEKLADPTDAKPLDRREQLRRTMQAIHEHELSLSRHLLEALGSIPGLHIWGIVDPTNLEQRVPTVSFTLEGWAPRKIAEELAAAQINAWDGNYYALAVIERLGLEASGGMLRIGLVHYNTSEEIERLQATLKTLR
jgi:cysteine desulfurase family protein (TIGR01976 family)